MNTRITALLLLLVMFLAVLAYAIFFEITQFTKHSDLAELLRFLLLQLFGEDADDDISATIKLWNGNDCIKT